MKTKFKIAAVLFFMLSSACQKEFLEKRPSKSLLVPTSLSEIQALLDNIPIMNNAPALNMLAADEFAITDIGLDRATANVRTAYLWLVDNYQGTSISDWNQQYEQVFYSNVAIDALEKLKSKNTYPVKGAALFYRAMAMFNLSQLFAKSYSPTNLNAFGLPYPTSADVNLRPKRGTLAQLYQNMLVDLNLAAQLLPIKPTTKNRPAQQSCYALLARIYLIMMDYHNAQKYAEKALELSSVLLDFNVAKTGFYPFGEPLPNGIDEVIFYQRKYAYTIFNFGVTSIDPTLDSLFNANDLRRDVLFFSGGGNIVYFSGYEGLTTSECYLIKAECLARANQITEATALLNQLLINRYKTGTFKPLDITSKNEALRQIINERRKDLFGRGTRWSDLRRLNQDPYFAITLSRISKAKTYILHPNSEKYVLKIPDQEIAGNNIEQN